MNDAHIRDEADLQPALCMISRSVLEVGRLIVANSYRTSSRVRRQPKEARISPRGAWPPRRPRPTLDFSHGERRRAGAPRDVRRGSRQPSQTEMRCGGSRSRSFVPSLFSTGGWAGGWGDAQCQLQIGDRFVDEDGEWEIVTRPWLDER